MRKKRLGRPGIYPWDDWFKRTRPFRLIKGRHYKCQPHSMGQQIRNAAANRGLRVSVQIEDKVLVITNWGAV